MTEFRLKNRERVDLENFMLHTPSVKERCRARRPYSGLMKANPWSRSPNSCMSVAKPFTTGSIDSNNGKTPTSVLVSLMRRDRGVRPPPWGLSIH